MKALLQQIVQKVQAYSGSYNQLDLIQGLDADALTRLEQALNLELPPIFRAALQYYGQTIPHPTNKKHNISIPHYGEMGLITEQQLIKVYALLKASNYQQIIEHDCAAIGKAAFWNPKWIPVAAYANHTIHKRLMNYDLLVLEESSPLYQHIIFWSNREGALWVMASSYQDYLMKFDRDLDAMDWDPTYGFSF